MGRAHVTRRISRTEVRWNDETKTKFWPGYNAESCKNPKIGKSGNWKIGKSENEKCKNWKLGKSKKSENLKIEKLEN